MNEIASLVSKSNVCPLRAFGPTRRGLRNVLLATAFGCLILNVTGCSTMSSIGSSMMFWNGDSDDPVVGGRSMSLEEIDVALAETAENMRQDPTEPYWPFHMGELHAATESWNEAVPLLQRALENDPGYAPAVALLSKIYYERGQHEDAITLLDSFIAGNADSPDALRAALALHLEAVGDVDAARATLDTCSDSKEARAARTFVTLRGYQDTAVIETARNALRDDPRSAVNHNNYGIALLFGGNPEDARKSFLKALDIDDKLPGAMYNMAIVEAFYFFNQEAGREWFKRYQQVASDDPDDLASSLGDNVSQASGKRTDR